MNAIAFRSCVFFLLLAPLSLADETKLDLRHGVPADAYLAVYSQQNPERVYQREYAEQVWKAVRDERLPERVLALVVDRLPEAQKEAANSLSAELQSIFEPVDWSAIAESREVAYGQVMEPPQTHHVLLLRLPSEEVAASCETALKKFGKMVERRSGGAVEAALDDSGNAGIYTLSLPKVKEFPFQPAFARVNDVLVLSTSGEVLRDSVGSLLAGGGSKFDDPRLVAAFDQLPVPEDALAFYDGRQQFDQMRSIGQFIRDVSQGQPEAVRWAGTMERIIDELAILDYDVAVEYTEGHRNRKAAVGQLVPDAEDKLLYRVCAEAEPFENWQRWVPADAQAFSLNSGANLHVLYEGIVQFLHDEIPEAEPALEKLEQRQQEWGVHLDRDILQAFSGECVSVTLPASEPPAAARQLKVVALRCHKPERIRELVGQWVGRLAETPYAQSQNLQLAPCEELAGFDELLSALLTALGVRPVIGFHDGWMIVASNPEAAQRVLRTRSGDASSIDTTEPFQRFGLEIDGPVYAIRYTDLAASTRQAAQFIRQIGVMGPMIAGMAGSQAGPEKVKPLQDALALLPAVANVVEKLDYLEARLSVVQAGDTAGSYVKRSVTLVRPPQEKQDDEQDIPTVRVEADRVPTETQ